MLMMRLLGPIITFVNRPWKVSILDLTVSYCPIPPSDVPSRGSLRIR